MLRKRLHECDVDVDGGIVLLLVLFLFLILLSVCSQLPQVPEEGDEFVHPVG